MPSQLGLVCITHSQEVRYRTVTRKHLLQKSEPAQSRLLSELYRDNIQRLEAAIRFCRQEGLALYRIPSGIFPFFDEDIGRAAMEDLTEIVGKVGERGSAAGLRMVMHPDQFVVLNSASENVVANSVKILTMHAAILDLLRQPRTPWALIEIHGGKSGRADELVNAIRALPEPVRTRIALENDEYAYGAEEIFAICRTAGVPMVFDAHHHIVKEKLDSYDDPSVAAMLAKARETWAEPSHQLVHISNGRTSFNDRQHSDLIEVMPASYDRAPWIEIEAKHKEDAIRKLRAGWHAETRAR